jgi:manganese-dependent ADP-ribose/CDP-alcohol diphosphatase
MLSRRGFIRGAFPILIGGCEARGRGEEAPLVRFGAIADIQYADRDTTGKRKYRESLQKLQAAVEALAVERLSFTIQLGDLIDEGAENSDRIAAVFQRIPGPKYHVLGNHDFYAMRAVVLQRFGLCRSYYSFRFGGWRFVVLDGMNVSVKGGWPAGSPNLQRGQTMLAEMKEQGAPNANDWNGAAGERQRAWLRRVLEDVQQGNERTVVFCHFPTLSQACRPEHLLWDHREVLEILDSQPSVAAYMSGHDHNGGYARHKGVHHLTLAGLVENDLIKCLRVVDVYPGRLVVRRPGENDGQVLQLRPITRAYRGTAIK